MWMNHFNRTGSQNKPEMNYGFEGAYSRRRTDGGAYAAPSSSAMAEPIYYGSSMPVPGYSYERSGAMAYLPEGYGPHSYAAMAQPVDYGSPMPVARDRRSSHSAMAQQAHYDTHNLPTYPGPVVRIYFESFIAA
jgi:hypothetical protein